MQHWYAYHSDKTMGKIYDLSTTSSFYLTKDKAGGAMLFKKDVIWVIEGDTSNPCQYMLADCFTYTESKPPPYKATHKRYNFNVKGLSLLDSKIPLDKQCEWFKTLHEQFITKRKFFYPLTNNIIQGLKEISLVDFNKKTRV